MLLLSYAVLSIILLSRCSEDVIEANFLLGQKFNRHTAHEHSVSDEIPFMSKTPYTVILPIILRFPYEVEGRRAVNSSEVEFHFLNLIKMTGRHNVVTSVIKHESITNEVVVTSDLACIPVGATPGTRAWTM